MLLLIPILLPIIVGALLPVLRIQNRSSKLMLIFLTLAVSAGCTLAAAISGAPSLTILSISKPLTIAFKLDSLGKIFSVLNAVLWLLIGLYSFRYMIHEKNEDRFFCFMLLALGCTMALDFSANLFTMYLAFELITLTTFPLVLHNQQPEAIRASLKYLFYSIAGAFLALFGLFLVASYSTGTSFVLGGVLSPEAMNAQKGLLLAGAFCCLVGFGAKCGLYPLHGWLPTAHPVAPAPASALLSALVVKAGVFCCIRSVYYLIGTDFLQGTWVQTTWIVLAMLTVFMGSMMAFREKRLKKRLAYSTVSQVSYILLGLACFNTDGATGGLLHSVFHAIIKSGLFMIAGAIIFETGATEVDELHGIGKRMPLTIACWTILSLALIGIPPTSGFVSKWFLGTGAFAAGLGWLSYLVPAVLLISALLTAGYLLPISIHGFLVPAKAAHGHDDDHAAPAADKGVSNCEPTWHMLVPIITVALAALLFGVFTEPLIAALSSVLM